MNIMKDRIHAQTTQSTGKARRTTRTARALLALLALTAGTLATTREAAAQVSCQIGKGMHMQPITMNLSQSLTSGTNVAGRTHDYTTNTSGFRFRLDCSAPSDNDMILTGVEVRNDAAVAGTEGPWTYYRVDDYFSIAFGWSDCSGTWYVPVRPFNSDCGGYLSIAYFKAADEVFAVLGFPPGTDNLIRRPTTWTVRLRVERAFSGPRVVNFPNIFRYYYGDVPSDAATLQMISLVGTITVPETCTINAGQTIQVTFGDIGAGRFEGKGQKPTGYTPVSTSAPVTCNDAAAQRNVKVSLSATPAPGLDSAIRTSNPDIGIVVTDDNDNIVRPNRDTLPLRLQNNGAGRNDGTVTMKAYPVSSTGNQPTQGPFSGTAAITVTFD
jgi:type 1 fimbria pilin